MPRTVKPKGEVKRGTPVGQIKQAPDYHAIVAGCGRMVLKNGTNDCKTVLLCWVSFDRDVIFQMHILCVSDMWEDGAVDSE